jgi:hypothetical protein
MNWYAEASREYSLARKVLCRAAAKAPAACRRAAPRARGRHAAAAGTAPETRYRECRLCQLYVDAVRLPGRGLLRLRGAPAFRECARVSETASTMRKSVVVL